MAQLIQNGDVLSGTSNNSANVLYSEHDGSSKNVQEKIEELNNSLQDIYKNDMGTNIDISSYTSQNPYIFPSDGYVLLEAISDGDNYVYGRILGNNGNYFTVQVSAILNKNNVKIPVYVRKGMKWFKMGSSGTTKCYFFPIE